MVGFLALSALALEAAPAAVGGRAGDGRTQLPPWPAAAVTLHVAPGAQAGNGTRQQPFGSLEDARDDLRARRARTTEPLGPAVVLVHGGEYALARTFSLSTGDSGTETAPIRYCAAPGETPRFRGGVRLHGWQRLADTNSFPQLPPEMGPRLWVCDLKAAGITNLLPLTLGGFASGRGFKTWPAHELFFNGKAMPLARGPNEGFLRISDVAVKDGTKGYDRQGSKTGKFFYTGDRPARWVSEPDLLLYGYWFWDWADSYERVASIDPKQRLITLAEPWHRYGFSIGAPFYAVNALSELDSPGEWYLDRQRLRIVFYPPSDPSAATIELSLFSAPALELKDVSNVSFEGLTWELGSADALRVQGGTNCLFAGCTVRHFAGNGLEVHGGSHHGVVSCDVYSLGRGGLVVSGGDRKTLRPGGHFVENCDIHDLSRIDHTYTPAVILDGVGNRVAHNRLHDVLSSALRVGGNEQVIEYNEVFRVVLESDDQGGADMFGNPTFRGNVYRFNYWHHIGNWRGTGEQPKCGQAGIRLDDAICGTRIHGNIFERCSAGKHGFGGVQIHGGKDNVVEENVFLDCAAAISFTPWAKERWQKFVSDALDNPAVDRALYVQRYPELARLGDDPNINLVRSNLVVSCGEFLRRAPKVVECANNQLVNDSEILPSGLPRLLRRYGLAPIPVADIGLYRDVWRKTIPGLGAGMTP